MSWLRPSSSSPRCVARGRKLAKLGQLAYAEVKRLIQYQAVERVRGATAEELKAWTEIAQSAESVALLEAQVRSISKERRPRR